MNFRSFHPSPMKLFQIITFYLIGDTRLGLMRTCLTLNDRPQECYNSELNTPWLFTLVAIFSGCICLTVTIVLMVISHWDRTVGPYAKWIGFSAGKKDKFLIFSKQFPSWTFLYFFCDGLVDYRNIRIVCFQSVAPTLLNQIKKTEKGRTVLYCNGNNLFGLVLDM